MIPCNCRPPFPRPEPFSPLPRPGTVPDWGKWIRDRLAEKGALLAFPTRTAFPDPGAQPNVYEALDTGILYRWDGAHYQVLVDPSAANDVLEYEDRGRFPETGEHGKLYIAANTGSLYRWGGGDYVALLPGKADKVADATEGNLAALTQDGNLADSGAKPADFATAAQGAKADTAVQPAAIAGFVDGAEYDADYGNPPKPTILLKHGDEVVATVDAADFVIDGMVSNVEVKNGNLVITFNTDSGKQPISIPLTDIFNPANYYDKDAVNALLNNKQDKLTFKTSVVRNSDNPVKSSGIWAAIWGALAALPTGFASLYDWCVAQLAGKASTADATLTGRSTEWVCSVQGVSLVWGDSWSHWGGIAGWVLGGDQTSCIPKGSFDSLSIEWTGNEQTFDMSGVTATRTALPGYQLGSQSDKPVASEVEVEALRNGKQDALTDAQLANIAAVSDALVFDATHSYAEGDPVVYNGTLYTFTTAHTGAWTGSDVSAVDILARLADKLDKSGGTLTGTLTLAEVDGGNTEIIKAFLGSTSSQKFVIGVNGGNFYIGQYGYRLWLPYADGTLARLENLAGNFSSSTVYAKDALVVYSVALYRCINPNGHTGRWAEADFTPATVEDVLAALRTGKLDKSGGTMTGELRFAGQDLGGNLGLAYDGENHRLEIVDAWNENVAYLEVPNTANGSRVAFTSDVNNAIAAIPYDLGTPIVIDTASSETVEGETVNYGAATLANRTANIVRVTAATPLDELRITFPAATSGKVRDFGLRVEIGTGSAALTAPALVPIAPTGETIKIENNAAEIPALADGTATAKGVTLLYFSETAPGVFVVKGEQVEEVA